MKIYPKIIIAFLSLLIVSATTQAQWDYYISGTDTADCDDVYLRSNLPTNNYGADATLLFGSQWNTMTVLIRFPHLADSLAAYDGDIDSVLMGLVCTGSLEAGDTLSMKAYTAKRNWVESEATWNIYSAGNNWETAGAKGLADRFDDASNDTLLLHDGDTGQLDTVYIRLGANFGASYNAAVLEMSYEVGAEAIYLGFYSSDHSSAAGPFLHVFGGGTGGGEDNTAPDPYDALDAVAVLHLDPDSLRVSIGTVDSTDMERTMLRWDTASIPNDTTDGYTLYSGAVLENQMVDWNLVVVQPDWLYLSIFAIDEADNVSQAVIDSIYLPAGGEGGQIAGRTNRMFEFLINKQERMNK